VAHIFHGHGVYLQIPASHSALFDDTTLVGLSAKVSISTTSPNQAEVPARQELLSGFTTSATGAADRLGCVLALLVRALLVGPAMRKRRRTLL
jgi:hypothetical protein